MQDKLWLPGYVEAEGLRIVAFSANPFRARRIRLLGVRRRHGPAQRPSWNYRKEDGGGIIIDMLCHWRYVLDNIFGPVKAVSCRGATHIAQRWDEQGKPYKCTADDAVYARSSWPGASSLI